MCSHKKNLNKTTLVDSCSKFCISLFSGIFFFLTIKICNQVKWSWAENCSGDRTLFFHSTINWFRFPSNDCFCRICLISTSLLRVRHVVFFFFRWPKCFPSILQMFQLLRTSTKQQQQLQLESAVSILYRKITIYRWSWIAFAFIGEWIVSLFES